VEKTTSFVTDEREQENERERGRKSEREEREEKKKRCTFRLTPRLSSTHFGNRLNPLDRSAVNVLSLQL
jgi:hypothetical protein